MRDIKKSQVKGQKGNSGKKVFIDVLNLKKMNCFIIYPDVELNSKAVCKVDLSFKGKIVVFIGLHEVKVTAILEILSFVTVNEELGEKVL